MTALIKIKNLSLRTIIGVNDSERKNKQDILINISFEYDDSSAVKTDDITQSIDYKSIKKKIIDGVEKSSFCLLESLCDFILKLVTEDQSILCASVSVDKPHSLRFAESVSVEKTFRRQP